jgi:hypothetical protein
MKEEEGEELGLERMEKLEKNQWFNNDFPQLHFQK